jgi:hypothetical protein
MGLFGRKKPSSAPDWASRPVVPARSSEPATTPRPATRGPAAATPLDLEGVKSEWQAQPEEGFGQGWISSTIQTCPPGKR